MKLAILVAAALAVAAPVAAKDRKPKEEAPPAPAAVSYEMQDGKMGDALEQACIAEPLAAETYDSKDDMLIVDLTGGGRAFLHFSGGCDLNTLMFASSAAGGKNSCVSTGDTLTFTASYGSKACKVSAINVWRDEAPISEYDTQDY